MAIGEGFAQAGQAIAQGIIGRREQKYRDKVFEEQKRQFDVADAAAKENAARNAAMQGFQTIAGLVESGRMAPEHGDQVGNLFLQSYASGQPVNVEQLNNLLSGSLPNVPQENVQNVMQATAQEGQVVNPVKFDPTGELQGNFRNVANAYTIERDPNNPSQFISARDKSSPARPLEEQSKPKIEWSKDVDPALNWFVEHGREGPGPYGDAIKGAGPVAQRSSPAPKIFPTAYDRVAEVPAPKAEQVRNLKPTDRVRLFREKPQNFDLAVKDAAEKGLMIPAKYGAYLEAKLLGKSDAELATILKDAFRDEPLSANVKAQLSMSRDGQKAQSLKDYSDMLDVQTRLDDAISQVNTNYEAAKKKYIEEGQQIPPDLDSNFIKDRERLLKTKERVSTNLVNYADYIKQNYKLDLNKPKDNSAALKYFQDRVQELIPQFEQQLGTSPMTPEARQDQAKRQAEDLARKETKEIHDFDVASARQPGSADQDDQIDLEFDELTANFARRTNDKDRAALAAIQELLKKYPGNQMLLDAQKQATQRIQTKAQPAQ